MVSHPVTTIALIPGNKVLIKAETDKTWIKQGVIVAVVPDNHTYLVCLSLHQEISLRPT